MTYGKQFQPLNTGIVLLTCVQVLTLAPLLGSTNKNYEQGWQICLSNLECVSLLRNPLVQRLTSTASSSQLPVPNVPGALVPSVDTSTHVHTPTHIYRQFKNNFKKLAVVAHSVERERSVYQCSQSQPVAPSEFQDSHSCRVKPCLNKTKEKKPFLSLKTKYCIQCYT